MPDAFIQFALELGAVDGIDKREIDQIRHSSPWLWATIVGVDLGKPKNLGFRV